MTTKHLPPPQNRLDSGAAGRLDTVLDNVPVALLCYLYGIRATNLQLSQGFDVDLVLATDSGGPRASLSRTLYILCKCCSAIGLELIERNVYYSERFQRNSLKMF